MSTTTLYILEMIGLVLVHLASHHGGHSARLEEIRTVLCNKDNKDIVATGEASDLEATYTNKDACRAVMSDQMVENVV